MKKLKERRRLTSLLGPPDSKPPPNKLHQLWLYQGHVCRLYEKHQSARIVADYIGVSGSLIASIVKLNGYSTKTKKLIHRK